MKSFHVQSDEGPEEWIDAEDATAAARQYATKHPGPDSEWIRVSWDMPGDSPSAATSTASHVEQFLRVDLAIQHDQDLNESLPASGFKFALLFLGHCDDDGSPIVFSEDLICVKTSLAELVGTADVSHWEQWIGSVAWSRLEEEQRIVSARLPSQRAAIMDGDNQTVANRVRRAARSYLLLSQPHWQASRWVIDGTAASADPRGALLRVHRSAPLDGIHQPFFATRQFYWKSRQPFGPLKPLMGWPELDALTGPGLPLLLDMGLYAFEVALSRPFLDFRIPDLVRAADTVLAVPKSLGRKGFAERSLRLCPEFATSSIFAGIDLTKFLIDLYDRRSSCVHGRIPFEDLEQRGEDGKDVAARFEYAAFQIARHSLLAALRHPERDAIFQNRTTLEDAWKAQRFP